MRRRRLRGRGAARRAELHQAVSPALQHQAARRQVLPVHRHLARRGLPPRLLHARAPPRRPRLLRPLLQRQARARHARGPREGVHVPLLHRSRARQAQRQSLPGLLHQALRGALRRICLQGGLPGEHRRRHRVPLRPLPRDRAGSRGAHARGRRRRGVRAGHARAQPAARGALAARAPARRQRVSRHLRRRRRRRRRPGCKRAGAAGSRRGALRPPVLLPLQRDRARSRRGRRGVHAPVLRRARLDPRAARRARRDRHERTPSPTRSPAAAAARSSCGPPSAARSGGSSSSPSATPCSRSTRSACAQSAATRAASRRSRACSGARPRRPPVRIECFDISNLGGTHTVASMVVFEGGTPKKSDYRRFTIQTVDGSPDDYASMAEVLRRRYAQWERQARYLPARPRL